MLVNDSARECRVCVFECNAYVYTVYIEKEHLCRQIKVLLWRNSFGAN